MLQEHLPIYPLQYPAARSSHFYKPHLRFLLPLCTFLFFPRRPTPSTFARTGIMESETSHPPSLDTNSAPNQASTDTTQPTMPLAIL